MRGGQAGDPPGGGSGVFDGRIITVPNLISVARLGCLPWFLWLLFGAGERWWAAVVWGALGATDWADGWWARRFNSESELGKVLDPVSDRLVLLIGVLAVGFDGSVPWWFVAATLLREGFISAAVLVIAALGARRVEVTWWGKCATFGLYFAYPFLLAGASEIGIAAAFRVAGWVCAVPSLIYSYLSAAQYVPLGLDALRSGRAAK